MKTTRGCLTDERVKAAKRTLDVVNVQSLAEQSNLESVQMSVSLVEILEWAAASGEDPKAVAAAYGAHAARSGNFIPLVATAEQAVALQAKEWMGGSALAPKRSRMCSESSYSHNTTAVLPTGPDVASELKVNAKGYCRKLPVLSGGGPLAKQDIWAYAAKFPAGRPFLQHIGQVKLLFKGKPAMQLVHWDVDPEVCKHVIGVGIKAPASKGMVCFWVREQRVTLTPGSDVPGFHAMIKDWTLPWVITGKQIDAKKKSKTPASVCDNVSFLDALKARSL